MSVYMPTVAASSDRLSGMPEDPRNPGHHVDPLTGIWPVWEWGASCYRGFVRNERFGAGQVIAGTNRAKVRAFRNARASQ